MDAAGEAEASARSPAAAPGALGEVVSEALTVYFTWPISAKMATA
jgi:hypothetical protein